MDDSSGVHEIDAVPSVSCSIDPNQNTVNVFKSKKKFSKKTLEALFSILDEFTIDDYKSIFFLLLDYITPDAFLSLIKKEKSILKDEFYALFIAKLSEEILLEMLGTMKMYRKLKSFGTCCHLFKQGKYFNEISEIRKVLYSLCEEITDDDLNIMKQHLPLDVRDEIVCAEEWFAFALQQQIITDSDLSKLKNIFKDLNPECLKIVDNYKGESENVKPYFIREPTKICHCGIAAIFNFKNFKQSYLKERVGSEVDVELLEHLWNTFGFNTIVHNEDLTPFELSEELKKYAAMDHSNYDVFVGCFLSHGEKGVIYASEGEPLNIDSLLGIITENCLTLEGKPKVFFIQACQGKSAYQIQPKSENSTYRDSDSAPEILNGYSCEHPALKDVFKVMSTVDGFVSWRHRTEGGIFIKTLYKVMMECGDRLSMDDVMLKVTESLSRQGQDVRQIPPTYKTLCKKLMLKKRTDLISEEKKIDFSKIHL